MRRLVFLLLFAACKEKDLYTPPPEPPGPVDNPERECMLAEQNLLALNCRDSRGRPLGGTNTRGEPFRDVCSTAWHNAIDMNPLCLKAAKSCEAVERCPR